MNDKTFEFSVLEGLVSIERATLGDLSVVIDRLRSGATLLMEERQLIAGILSGDVKRPAHRPRKLDTELRDERIKEDALVNRALDPKGRPGVTRVAYEHAVSTKWVYRLLAEVEADPEGHAETHARVARTVALYYSILLKQASEADRGVDPQDTSANP